MTETLSCPVDHANFFSDDDPEFAKASRELAIKLNTARPDGTLSIMLRDAFNEVVSLYPDNVGAMTARFLAASVLRGSVASAVSHQNAMKLTPLATQLLEGDQEPLQKAINDPGFQAVASRDAIVGTDPHFNRVWHGDDARLITLTGLLIQKSVQDAAAGTPWVLSRALTQTSEWATRCARDLAEEHKRKRYGRKGVEELDELLEEGAFIADTQRRLSWIEEHVFNLAGQGKSGAQQYSLPDTGRGRVLPFLSHQAESNSEHIAAFMTDVLHGITWAEGKVVTNGLLRTMIAHLHMPSASAFMPNELLAKAEYDGRYVRADSSEQGRYGAKREPMVLVDSVQDLYSIIPNPASKYSQASRNKRNRCPGPNQIPPREANAEKADRLRDTLKATIANSYDRETLTLLDRHFTTTDLVGIMSTKAACYLVDTGLATFSPKEVQRYLGYPEQATSNGIRALKKSLVRNEPREI